MDLDGPVHYVDYGGPDGAPVLVGVHGLGGSHLNWAAVAPHLIVRSRLVAVDLVGHGHTPTAGRTAHVDGHVDLLAGFAAEVSAIALGISDAASHFLLNQLPELYAGIDRATSPFPVQHLGANVPQAWAAGSAFALLQAILGIEQDAPNNRLWVDPALPAWLPDVTLTNLPMGPKRFSLRFTRTDQGTDFQVLNGDPAVVARRPFMSWVGPSLNSGTFK